MMQKAFDGLSRQFQHFGHLFYLNNVTETSYKTVPEVPDLFRNSWPSFLILLILENIILYHQRKPTLRLNDGITSLSHGLIQECGKLLFRGSEKAAYIYVHNTWRVVDLPWNTPFTWFLALLTVDFAYYWAHRASHEINIFWAQHQVHHSSEEFNVPVGFRQSIFQGWCSIVFYLPMAFFVPPSHFITHQQFNMIYQIWIHTKTIGNLGLLELVLNTPRHHRIHHGCNLYCLDKNYGGLLIVWDRIFGTFAEEENEEDIVYGLVYQPSTFNPLFLQLFYNRFVVDKFISTKRIQNKMISLVKGPSWMPGSSWTGSAKDKLDVKFRIVYDVKISPFLNAYVLLHFIAILAEFHGFSIDEKVNGICALLTRVSYVIASLTILGLIFDNHPKALHFETIRCFVCFLLSFFENVAFSTMPLLQRLLFFFSICIWSKKTLKRFYCRMVHNNNHYT